MSSTRWNVVRLTIIVGIHSKQLTVRKRPLSGSVATMSARNLVFVLATGRRRGPGFVTLFCLFGVIGQAFAQPGRGPSPVVVSRVVSTRQAASVSFVGSLVPLKRSTIGSAVDGRVTQVLVDDGDAVTVDESTMVNGQPLGQLLVQLRTVSLDIEIDAAEIELRLASKPKENCKQPCPPKSMPPSPPLRKFRPA